tara:strand:- start:672 stop:1037 length:366 start_codon:yes stop_codon:yes gene_type:complete
MIHAERPSETPSEPSRPELLTPDLLLGDGDQLPAGDRSAKRARDMATMAALLGLMLVAGVLLAILALVLNQLLVFAIVAVVVLGGFYLSFHYLVWGRRLDRQIAESRDGPSPVGDNDADLG